MQEPKIIKPQPGFQEKFLSSPADIVIGGSAAGVGKTYGLLLEYLRNKDVKGFGGVIFRRTSPQIRLEGGLWDTSMAIYPFVGATPRESSLEWNFGPSKLKFAHLEYEKNKLDYQGAQIPLIGFDELTHFSETMFFYLLTRNRSTCGVKPYVRATCNPDPESWVAKLIEWWIDQDTGYPIPERDGVVRYFIRYGSNYIWGDNKQEVIDKAQFVITEMLEKSRKAAEEQGIENSITAEDFVKSITFISGSIYQNQELLKINPAYLANLLSQDEATRRSLLDSNWKFVQSDADIYDYESFKGMFENVFEVKEANRKRIVADIALKGSNKFIVSYFEGRSLEDMTIMEKSDGKEVLDAIVNMAIKHGVANKDILFDADGVGGYIDGFLKGSKSFHGGARPMKVYNPVTGKNEDENYFNLKTQLIYRAGDAVNRNKYVVSDYVQNMRFDKSMTVKQRMIFERKAFKRDKIDHDGKLKVIGKDEMKAMLQNESPDVLDTLFMNELFEIKRQPSRHAISESQAKTLYY